MDGGGGFVVRPVAHVRGGRTEATKDGWGESRARIELVAGLFGPDALAGLADHSHLEVVWLFHLHADEATETGARHPRGRPDWPRVGILSQRARMRPNRIGVSICEIVSVGTDSIEVRALDAVDGTPVLDIKPVWSGNRPRGDFREPQWAKELMRDYW